MLLRVILLVVIQTAKVRESLHEQVDGIRYRGAVHADYREFVQTFRESVAAPVVKLY